MNDEKRAIGYGVLDPNEEGNIIQLIIFTLGDEEFGAAIKQIREIIKVASITLIPDSPDFIKGITNVRGEISVLINLKARFFLQEEKELPSKHIIITEQKKNLFGLMVDEVTEVLRIPETDIKPTPELVTRIDRTYISGVLTLGNRMIMLLDLARVLSDEELSRLARISKRHQAQGQETTQAAAEERETMEEAAERTEKTEEAITEQVSTEQVSSQVVE